MPDRNGGSIQMINEDDPQLRFDILTMEYDTLEVYPIKLSSFTAVLGID